ncbi:hypothetical protein Dimus_020179 [Dionaea muscipula]
MIHWMHKESIVVSSLSCLGVVMLEYGEIVDVNLVRDKASGKSKGFAFIAYEDQRSTNLAVDNLNGAQILGRVIRVDHVTDYKKKEEEDEEEERKKREARGVCRAFQRGECNRGAGCKFLHDEQRAADTGWGPQEERGSRWGHDRFDDQVRSDKRSGEIQLNPILERHKADEYHARSSRGNTSSESHHKRNEIKSSDDRRDGHLEPNEKADHKDREMHVTQKRSSKHEPETNPREDHNRREEKRARRSDLEMDRRVRRDEKDREREREKTSSHARKPSSQYQRDCKDDDDDHRSHR